MYVFFVVVFSLYALLNYYLISRGWHFIQQVFPFVNKSVYFICMVMLCLMYIFAMSFFRYSDTLLAKTLEGLGTTWIVIMFYGVLFLLVLDGIRILAYFVNPLQAFITTHAKLLILFGGGFFIVFLVALLIIGKINATVAKVTNYTVEIPKKVEGIENLKIVFISDLHLGIAIDRTRLKAMMDGVISRNPDLVLFGGDIIEGDSTVFEKQGMAEEIRRLQPKYGVYGISGNHDYFGQDYNRTLQALKESGIQLLIDDKVLVANSFYLLGRDDRSSDRFRGKQRTPLSEIAAGIDPNKPVILMDHQPFQLEEAVQNGVDLQVSGHTHHGQFWPNNLITSKIYEVDWGYLKKNNTHIIVSCGIGTWGPQIRLGSYSEIVEINVKFTADAP